MGLVLDHLGSWLGRTLSRPVHVHDSAQPTPTAALLACLRPGDVLLVEGKRSTNPILPGFATP